MAERVARVVGEGTRRRIGFGTFAAVLIAAAVLLAAGAFASAPSARTFSARARDRGQQQSINAQVNSLISRMTVAEKFGQLEMAGPDGPNGTPGDLVTEAKNGQIGSVLDLVGVNNINQVQQAALQSRLQIPLIFGLDVIHGYKTMFPVPLGEASSWDPAMVQNDESVSASEATADGIKWTFNPMVDISRDPALGPGRRRRRRGSVSGLGDRRRQGSRLPGLRFQRPGQDGRDDQALRGLWRPGRGPRIQHGRHVDPAAVQRLPAALQGGGRRRRRDRDELVQLAQRRAQHRQSVHAYDDPARRVGLRRHGRQRLPGRPGARGLRLRRERRAGSPAGTDGRNRHRDGGTGEAPARTPPTPTTDRSCSRPGRSRWPSSTTRSATC